MAKLMFSGKKELILVLGETKGRGQEQGRMSYEIMTKVWLKSREITFKTLFLPAHVANLSEKEMRFISDYLFGQTEALSSRGL